MPLYIKYNSYGELVFDWNWADAYRRAGLAYYPKLVSTIPYTPVTSPRLFALHDDQHLKQQIIEQAKQAAASMHMSSFHVLFTTETDRSILLDQSFLPRNDVQFHWHNDNYESFAHYLSSFTAKKRKNVNRERRLVTEQGIQIDTLSGNDLDQKKWNELYPFYRDTFLKKGGVPTLSQDFFQYLSREIGEQIVIFAARFHGEYVAAAICFKSNDTLYGRHWGCHEQFNSLHFELCYYQGIEYAINHRLARFEPGAQGEHKISRGFLPTTVHSSHWIAHPQFSTAIANYLQHERSVISSHQEELEQHSPFRMKT